MPLTSSPIQLLLQQRLLLDIEYQTEKDAYKKQTETMGIQRKVKRGDAWWPVKVGKTYYNSLNQLAIEVYRQGDEEIEHNFEYGRTVTFFTTTGEMSSKNHKLSYIPQTASVSYVDGDKMVLTVPEKLISLIFKFLKVAFIGYANKPINDALLYVNAFLIVNPFIT